MAEVLVVGEEVEDQAEVVVLEVAQVVVDQVLALEVQLELGLELLVLREAQLIELVVVIEVVIQELNLEALQELDLFQDIILIVIQSKIVILTVQIGKRNIWNFTPVPHIQLPKQLLLPFIQQL